MLLCNASKNALRCESWLEHQELVTPQHNVTRIITSFEGLAAITLLPVQHREVLPQYILQYP